MSFSVRKEQMRTMTRMRFSLLFLALTPSLLSIASASEPTYTPAEISELVRSGSAREHGAQFANQGRGCLTYLWIESDRHTLFVFLRDGVSYGEFRDEVLLDGGFISTTEQYLVADSREKSILLKTEVLRFVRKQELAIWKDEVCVGSTIRWSFLSTTLNGKVLEREAVIEKRMVRGVVSVIFPDRQTPNGETFLVGLERKSLTPHEIAFGRVSPIIETFGLSNRRCSIWAQWPQDDPELVVILNKRLLKDPLDSGPEFRTKRVASMTISLDPPMNVPFIFVP